MGRALLFHGPGHIFELVSYAVPDLCGAEILVRVTCCTLCRSDVHTYVGRRTVPTPTVLGHEVVGQIEALGPSAPRVDELGSTLSVGDRVVWSISVGCGRCFYCTTDLPQKCKKLYKYGHVRTRPDRPNGGGLADYVVLVPGTAIFRVPDQISDCVAALSTCAAATVAAMFRLAGDVAQRTVVILGAGILGVLACAMAAAAGARHVVTFDPDARCSERAGAFAATHSVSANPDELTALVAELTQGRGADIVLELAGAASSVQLGMDLLRTGGRLMLAGSVAPTNAIAIDPERVVRQMYTIRGVHNYHPRDLAAALTFLSGPGLAFPFASLVGRSFLLGEVQQAFEYAARHAGVRTVVNPS
jgi:putative phosphonate catabolism associated alcohol dehydrogenase